MYCLIPTVALQSYHYSLAFYLLLDIARLLSNLNGQVRRMLNYHWCLRFMLNYFFRKFSRALGAHHLRCKLYYHWQPAIHVEPSYSGMLNYFIWEISRAHGAHDIRRMSYSDWHPLNLVEFSQSGKLKFFLGNSQMHLARITYVVSRTVADIWQFMLKYLIRQISRVPGARHIRMTDIVNWHLAIHVEVFFR